MTCLRLHLIIILSLTTVASEQIVNIFGDFVSVY